MLTGAGEKIYNSLSFIGSVLIAIARLFFIVPLFAISALNQILFARYEICAAEMRMLPLRCDRKAALDKLSYVDKLCAENPELLDLPEEDEELNDFDDNLDDHGDSNI